MRDARQLSPRDRQHTPDYRTVAVYWTVPEAELARSLLAADGIPVAAIDTVDAALLPGTSPVRLLVPADDLARARELLEARGPAPVLADRAVPDEAGPVHGATSTGGLVIRLLVLALILAGLLSL